MKERHLRRQSDWTPSNRGTRPHAAQTLITLLLRLAAVTDFNNGLEASSDSDDEDKLHIVEEDSLQEPEVANADGTKTQDSHDAATTTTTVLPHNGCLNGVKEEYVSEEEEEAEEDTLVDEILQQGDTAVIYPEAPDDEQSPAETGGADENGTPDSFSQLHTCPYCSRGYKRNASLKEHIKYRHETSEDNYSCTHCSYTFTYRSQLERHMSHHRGTREQRHVSQSTGGTRKFKCTECSKAFKYKHHLKEHLRIHSGEKPYECSNCKKRFSHSGSYSSHISSKKCVGAAPPNGVPRTSIKSPAPTTQTTPAVIAPARMILKEKTDSKPLQEQLPVTQIKSEPVEYECKPVIAAPATSAGTNGGTAQPAVVPTTTLPQGLAMVVPTVGLMSPISINLSDLQNVLKVAMDGNVLRQVLGTANGVVTQGKQGFVVQQPQHQIISLPAFVDHDGTTKIIINYSISSAAATTTQTAAIVAKTSPAPLPTVTTAATPTPTKTDRPSTPEVTDLSIVKTEPESVAITDMETEAVTQTARMPKVNSTSTCLLCDDCPDNLEALHLLQHRKAANGEAVDSAALDPSFAALLSEAGVTLEEPPVDDLLSLLKTYFASNANPSEEELTKISESVSIHVDVVRKWFAKMNSGKNVGKYRKIAMAVSKNTETTNSSSEDASNQNGVAEEDSSQETSNKDSSESGRASPSDSSPLSRDIGDLIIVKSEPEDPDFVDSQAEPLDLSLPKHITAALETTTPPAKQQEYPLNLTCLRKEQLEGRTIYVTTPQTGRPVSILTAAQLPTLVAIAGQGTMSCLKAINTTTKRTILIPQLTYTYATTAGSVTGAKTVVLNGHKEKKLDSSSDGVSPVEEQNDSDSAALMKKRRLENGVYPCDLCSKVFQKGSSLLRHKYEHTGKRPHECNICKKAFKHKHHLIEHSRLHSGEKPYQCDKCGKRFSHSGSYSQHMNHRYSYCKKDGPNSGSGSGPRRVESELGSPGAGLQSDSRTTTPPSQLDSDERESEEEEDEDDEAMCMDDIRVVQVDDGDCEIYEGNFEDDDEEEGEEIVEEDATGEEEAEGEEIVEEDATGEEEAEGEEMVEEDATGEEEVEGEEMVDEDATGEEEAEEMVEEDATGEEEGGEMVEDTTEEGEGEEMVEDTTGEEEGEEMVEEDATGKEEGEGEGEKEDATGEEEAEREEMVEAEREEMVEEDVTGEGEGEKEDATGEAEGEGEKEDATGEEEAEREEMVEAEREEMVEEDATGEGEGEKEDATGEGEAEGEGEKEDATGEEEAEGEGEKEDATGEEEAEGEKVGEEVVCDVLEVGVGEDHMEDEKMEETTEEKEEATGADTEEMPDCEANTDKSVREESDGAEPTEEVVTTNAK
ncbi:zinc finger E-box-binding homeobox 1-like isoform X2 [Anarhichas minor]|uniref:zinc finger E-box-binding homeobox 1-like isoform X2 n=1 Tax=Anarhichas minor TaxID=65739 RepID=UPI003F736355